MELKPNMYVRYKDFSYDKVVKIGKIVDEFLNVDTSNVRVTEHNVIKASYEIIDLVEVEDYVNGYPVAQIYN